MEHSLWTRRQILKAAGAAGGLAGASSFLSPGIFLAADEVGQRGEASLGRFGPWSEPRQLGELAADPSRGDFDFHPAISRDQLTLYFTTTRYAPVPPFGKPPLPPTAIAVVHRSDRDAAWDTSTLTPLNSINDPGGKATGVPNLTADGHVMYFQSGRSDPSLAPGHGHLWFSHRRHRHDDFGPFGWETPKPVPGNLNTAAPSQLNQSAATYFRNPADGTARMYYAQFEGVGGFANTNQDFDIYVSYQDSAGNFSEGLRVESLEPIEPGEPEPTEVLVKKWSRQTRTAIRRDGLEMYITSCRRSPSYANPANVENLWVATRPEAATEHWTVADVPVPLLNSGFGEGGPALSSDGKTLYFFSARPTLPGQTQEPHNWQLWMSTREQLED